ncbi:MAG TPA: hypothetical protein VGF47_09480 [Solirubrobacteraceae bacterium]|jgi:hypothetical protein
MIIDDKTPRRKPRPARGFPEEPPPGFFLTEGTSILVIAAERIGGFLRNVFLRRSREERDRAGLPRD